MVQIKKNKKPFIIAISGGSGSGKTTLAGKLAVSIGIEKCSIFSQDNYYKDQSSLFDYDGGKVNFDDPESVDFDQMASDLERLSKGEVVQVPIYDFTTHSPKKNILKFKPTPVIIVDGTLILTQSKLRKLFNSSIFLDIPESLRFVRRLERDLNERGRDAKGVKEQYNMQVKPMHDKFVDPSKKNAIFVFGNDYSIKSIIEIIKKNFSPPVMILPKERSLLLKSAADALKQAYAPYSNFRVGAALLTFNNNLFKGCNVENISYGLTVCAERSAIFSAVADEGCSMRVRALAVVNELQKPCSPCGACRQVIFEFGPDATIFFHGKRGIKEIKIAKLIPYAFGTSNILPCTVVVQKK